MRQRIGWIVAVLAIASAVPACTRAATVETARGEDPARVERIEGSDVSRVILSRAAADRLGIRTATVERPPRRLEAEGTAVPYAAVLYDASGRTWTYTNPEPLTFVRAPITIAQIRQGLALLSSGPPVGTPVVTVGASELLGTEYGVGEE